MNSTIMEPPAEDLETLDADNATSMESSNIPPEEENDATGALLRRIADRSSQSEPNLAYPDLGDDDSVDEQALHSIVEELQIGHDLRLSS